MSNRQAGDLTGFSQTLAALVEEAAHGVVAVKSAAYRVTSGVAIRDNLIAVTSHSLRRDHPVPVQTADGNQAEATILGRDPGIDLAILKVDGLKANPLRTADPASAKVGMLTLVVGLTVDVGVTASLGILGAKGPARRNWRGGTLDEYFRIDVNPYPSQSGAAVVSAEGELIGMATPALSRHSVVAVPVSTIDRIARELLEQGRIRHGYLGIGVQPVAVGGNVKSTQKTGLILLSVESDSPAGKAGLLLGDVLLTLDGKPVADIDDLQAALRGDVIGKILKASLIRGGEVQDVEITIAERGKNK
jgi:S1-C subfamily serine protease